WWFRSPKRIRRLALVSTQFQVTSWSPEYEHEKAAEDVGQALRYAGAVNTAVVRFLAVADAEPRDDLLDRGSYLETARDLCPLLSDVVEEGGRRGRRLPRFDRKKRKEPHDRANNNPHPGGYAPFFRIEGTRHAVPTETFAE